MKTKITIFTLGITLLSVATTSAQLVADAGSDQSVCSGSSVTIGGSPTGTGGTGTYTYAWSPATGLSSTSIANPTASPTATTTYTVIVVSGTSTATSSVIITVNPLPHVTNPTLTDLLPCTGGLTTFVPTSSVVGSTFTYTASASSGFITGWSPSGFANINDVLINAAGTGGTVTYVFTPMGPPPTYCVGPTASYVVTLSTCVGIEEYNNDGNFTLFPNPTSSTFTITSTDKIETMKLYNILGELLITETINNNQSTINISQFSKGIYFAEIKTEKGIVRKKVVKE